jgi:hypothetical protein
MPQVHRRESSLKGSWYPASETTNHRAPLDEDFIKRRSLSSATARAR